MRKLLDRILKSRFFSTPNGKKTSLALAFAFIGSVGLDQVSKEHVQQDLLVWEDPQDDDVFRGKKLALWSVGEKYPAPEKGDVPYFGFNFQYSRNKGAAFSMLSDLPDHIRVPLFYGITVIAVILISYYLLITPLHHLFSRYGLVLILSGAIGNFLDRVHRGYVVDFVDVDWNLLGWRHDFAIFNVADVAINIGVICLVLDMIIHRKENLDSKKPETEQQATASS